MFKISENEIKGGGFENWFSTHPDSKERAEYIIDYSKKFNTTFETVIAESNWSEIQKSVLFTESEY